MVEAPSRSQHLHPRGRFGEQDVSEYLAEKDVEEITN